MNDYNEGALEALAYALVLCEKNKTAESVKRDIASARDALLRNLGQTWRSRILAR